METRATPVRERERERARARERERERERGWVIETRTTPVKGVEKVCIQEGVRNEQTVMSV